MGESTSIGEELWIPEKVHYQDTFSTGSAGFGISKIRKRRLCKDNRPYFAVPITTIGAVSVFHYPNGWAVDRPYWIARVTATAGVHDDDTHPDDGAPQGQAIRIQLVREQEDESGQGNILDQDTRIRIDASTHRDVITTGDEGPFNDSHLNIKRLFPGEVVSLNITQVGSTSPGGPVTVTLMLVPYPWPGRDEDE